MRPLAWFLALALPRTPTAAFEPAFSDKADLVISGRIAALRASARSHSSVFFAIEYGLTLEVELEVAAREGMVLARVHEQLEGTERYLSSADVEAERKNRDEAVRRVAAVLASRYFDRISEALQP